MNKILIRDSGFNCYTLSSLNKPMLLMARYKVSMICNKNKSIISLMDTKL